MELTLYKAAFALYCASAALATGYLFSKNEVLARWMWRLLGVALGAHLSSLGIRLEAFWRVPENRWLLPLNTFFGVLSWLALANATILWIVEGRFRLNVLGAFVLPWTVLSAGASLLWADPSLSGLEPELRSAWLNIHPLVLMTAYAAFANAFGVGLAWLIQERQVKSRKPSELCYRLPAIEELDQLNYRIIALFLPVLTAGILMGGFWASDAWGRFWGWDAKETGAAVTWALYAAYLSMRLLGGRRGRRAVYVSMAGFASVIFTFVAVSHISRLHGYLTGG